MENVLTWKTALDNGLEPRRYSYDAENIPMGEAEAILDFKIWSKVPSAINCYFTERVSGKCFRLTVFKRKTDEAYGPDGGGPDFKTCPAGTWLRLHIIMSKGGYAMLSGAEPIGE